MTRRLSSLVALTFSATLLSACLFASTGEDSADDTNADAARPDVDSTDVGSDAGTDTDTPPPTLRTPPDSVCPEAGNITGLTSISAGTKTMCGLAASGHLICWGSTDTGLFGSADTSTRPATQIGGRTYREVTLGPSHACAIGASDSRPYCWGSNDWAYFIGGDNTESREITGTGKAVPSSGDPTIFPPETIDFDPVGNADEVALSVAVGRHHTCAIEGGLGRVICWGSGRLGQRGDASTDDQPQTSIAFALAPDNDDPLSGITHLSAGGYHVCAAGKRSSSDGRGDYYCWGANTAPNPLSTRLHQLGTTVGDTSPYIAPRAQLVSGNFPTNPPAQPHRLALGEFSSCAITDRRPDDTNFRLDKSLHCWGDNAHRQCDVANSDVSTCDTPYQLLDSLSVDSEAPTAHLATGNGAACVSGGNNLICWGRSLFPDLSLQEVRSFTLDSTILDIAIGESNLPPTNQTRTFACVLTEGASDQPTDNQIRCVGQSPPGLQNDLYESPNSVPCR